MAVTYSHQSVSSQFPSFVSFFFFSLNRVSKAILNHLLPLPPPVSCTFPTFLPRRWIFDDRVNYSCKFTSRGQHNSRPPSNPILFLFFPSKDNRVRRHKFEGRGGSKWTDSSFRCIDSLLRCLVNNVESLIRI